jgi:hypothetical protein
VLRIVRVKSCRKRATPVWRIGQALISSFFVSVIGGARILSHGTASAYQFTEESFVVSLTARNLPIGTVRCKNGLLADRRNAGTLHVARRFQNAKAKARRHGHRDDHEARPC